MDRMKRFFQRVICVVCVFFSAVAFAASEDKNPRKSEITGEPLQNYVLSFGAAENIARACLRKAEELGQKVAVVVVDSRGDIRVVFVMDGQEFLSYQWSLAKALGALEFRQPTAKGTFQILDLFGKTIIVGASGGFPLVAQDKIFGAIGVSGTKGADDDKIASAGVEFFIKSVLSSP